MRPFGFPHARRAWAIILAGLRLSLLVASFFLAGCREHGVEPGSVAADSPSDRPRMSSMNELDSTLSCGADCILRAGTVPGFNSVVVPMGTDIYSAVDSVVYPDTFPEPTWAMMKVEGTISRRWKDNIYSPYTYLSGTSMNPIDADGEVNASSCGGHIFTAFRHQGWATHNLSACDFTYNNIPAIGGLSVRRVFGVLQGSGKVGRSGMLHTTIPGHTLCGGTPCYHAVSGQQTVSIHPWHDRMALSASPSEVTEGDSVTFTASTGLFSVVSGTQRWSWVPHERFVANIPVADPPDTKTGTCANGVAVCKIPVHRTGIMYLKAGLVPGARTEQAPARVVVKPLKLVASSRPRALGLMPDSVTVKVSTIPERDFNSLGISGGLVGGSPGTVACNASSGECRLQVQAPATLTVTATTTTGVELTTTVSIDTMPCPTGDPLLDSKEFRLAIDSLWKLGGNVGVDSSRRERTALLIDSAGHLVTRYLPLTSATPCNTPSPIQSVDDFSPPGFLPGVMRIVASFHTHPFLPGDRMPANCKEVAGMRMGTGPSQADWHSLYDVLNINRNFSGTFGTDLLSDHFRSVVVEPARLWLMKQPENWRTVVGENGKLYDVPQRGQVQPNLSKWDRSLPLDVRSCVSPSTAGPTYH